MRETVGSFGLCFINPPIGGLIVSYIGIELFFSSQRDPVGIEMP